MNTPANQPTNLTALVRAHRPLNPHEVRAVLRENGICVHRVGTSLVVLPEDVPRAHSVLARHADLKLSELAAAG